MCISHWLRTYETDGAKDKCCSKPYRSSVVQIQSWLSTPRCFPLKLWRKNSSPKRKGNFSVRSMKKLWISPLDPFRSLGTVQKSSSEGHAKREACLCAEKQTRCPCSIWLQGMCSGRPKHDTVFCSTAFHHLVLRRGRETSPANRAIPRAQKMFINELTCSTSEVPKFTAVFHKLCMLRTA